MSPLMRELASLLFIHVWLAGFAYGIYDTIWGNGTDKSYDARMKSSMRWLLMSGSLSDKKVWAKQQRVMAWLAIPFVGVIYVGSLISILNGQFMF